MVYMPRQDISVKLIFPIIWIRAALQLYLLEGLIIQVVASSFISPSPYHQSWWTTANSWLLALLCPSWCCLRSVAPAWRSWSDWVLLSWLGDRATSSIRGGSQPSITWRQLTTGSYIISFLGNCKSSDWIKLKNIKWYPVWWSNKRWLMEYF